MPSWSFRIEDRFELNLDPCTRSWFDGACSQFQWHGEFDQPLPPATVVESLEDVVWPGFMLPDTVPLVGNRYGDWLCLRVSSTNHITEVLHWYHGGGDYVPYGSNLAESLFYDLCQSENPGRAKWAEERPLDAEKLNGLSWIAEHLGVSNEVLQEILRLFSRRHIDAGLEAIAEQGWCQAVVTRDRMLRALQTPLWNIADPKLAKRWNVSWETEMLPWLFDTRTIPSEYRSRMDQLLSEVGTGSSDWSHQAWDRVEALALGLIQARGDLAWPFDLAGWSAFQRGDTRLAIERWWQGLACSLFSDQSTQFHSHWFDHRFGKFAAAQLWANRSQLTQSQQQDPYWKMLSEGANEPQPLPLHRRVTEYWRQVANKPQATPQQVYRAWIAAGWDVGCQPLADFEPILEQLRVSAEQAGSKTQATLATIYASKLKRFRPQS